MRCSRGVRAACRNPERSEGPRCQKSSRETGAPGGTRTPNLQLRRLALYPIELRARAGAYSLPRHRHAVACRTRLPSGACPQKVVVYLVTTWKLPAAPSAAALGTTQTS